MLARGPKHVKEWSLLGDSHPQTPATGTSRWTHKRWCKRSYDVLCSFVCINPRKSWLYAVYLCPTSDSMFRKPGLGAVPCWSTQCLESLGKWCHNPRQTVEGDETHWAFVCLAGAIIRPWSIMSLYRSQQKHKSVWSHPAQATVTGRPGSVTSDMPLNSTVPTIHLEDPWDTDWLGRGRNYLPFAHSCRVCSHRQVCSFRSFLLLLMKHTCIL